MENYEHTTYKKHLGRWHARYLSDFLDSAGFGDSDFWDLDGLWLNCDLWCGCAWTRWTGPCWKIIYDADLDLLMVLFG